MKKGRHVISSLILITSVLFSSLAQADFEFKDSTLPVQDLEVEPSNHIDGDYLKNSGAALRWDPNGERYFFGYALGLPQYNRPDSLYSTVWEVVYKNECVALKLFPLKEYRALGLGGKGSLKDHPFPQVGCFDLDDKCTTQDGKVLITNTFEGITKNKKVRGGWFGSEGLMDVPFLTGEHVFSITHVLTGNKISVIQKLSDSSGYSTMRYKMEYLPELNVVILFGIRDTAGRLQSYCIKLPEENTSQSH